MNVHNESTASLSRLIWSVGILLLYVCRLHGEAPSIANNWHQWRGPEANGLSRTATPPIAWSEEKNIQWRVPIDGNGSSTPIIWQDKVFLLTAIDTNQVDPEKPGPEDQPKKPNNPFGVIHPNTSYEHVVLCLNRNNGEELWRKKTVDLVPHEGHHGDNNFASESPMTDGERLYCYFGSAGIFCLDLDGKELWRRELGPLKMQAFLGEGSSPVVHKDRVIIVRDQAGQSRILVLSAQTGETVWERERDETGSWATPRVIEHNGKTQVITSGATKIRSYDLDNGELIWECGGLTENAIPCPVIYKDTVFCMTGYSGFSLLALPLDASGDLSDSERIKWKKDDDTPYVPSPLLYDDLLYYTRSNKAILTCVNADTGEEVIKRSRLRGLQSLYASPVGADNHIYITARNGTTIVLERSTDELKILATNKLDDQINASAALAGKQLFLRGKKSLYCIAEE